MFRRHLLGASAALLISLALAACAGGPAHAGSLVPAQKAPVPATQLTPAAASTNPVANAAQGAEVGAQGGGEGGAEAALVTYADSAQGFSIGYPGPWTQDRTVTKGVKFAGGDDSLTLEFLTPDKQTDPLAYAQSDLNTASAAFPGFKQVGLALSTEVKDAAVLGFQAQGTSLVTGKTYQARGDRYYIRLPDGRIALLTVVGPANHYDRESIRDITLTLKVKK
jgi:hypothetical protein